MSSATLFQIIKWLGVGYLIFIGFKMLISRKASAETGEHAVAPKRSMRLFSEGLVTQLSNPKAIVFFSALLPQFVSADGKVVEQFAILGIISLAIELLILVSYGWAADRGSRFILKGRFSLVDRLAGGALIGAGLGLAATKRL
jgi:homoserine/homoserine lactone efflux protein